MALYHYFGVATLDKNGAGLKDWQIEVVDGTNLSTVIPIYADENSTPISSVSGLVNRAKSDDSGNYDLYVSEGTYGLKFYDQDGIYKKTIRYVQMEAAATLKADLASTATGKGAALVKLNNGSDLQSAWNYTSNFDHWQGLGWLTPFRKRIMDGLASHIVLTGDSTTSGTNVSADFVADKLMNAFSRDHGAYYQVHWNRGQAGQDTVAWLATYLSGDITNGGNTPSLIIARWGANDPLVSGNNATQVAANYGSAIDTIRATYALTACPILIMTPGPMTDSTNGRDDAYFNELAWRLRDVSRVKNVAFFDSFNFLRDAQGLAGTVYDNPYADGRAIHPSEGAMTLLYMEVAEKLYGGIGVKKKNLFWNPTYSALTALPTAAPSTYNRGLFHYRSALADGWPLNGWSITHRHTDGDAALQIHYASGGSIKLRTGAGPSWDGWINLSNGTAKLSPGTGYVLPATTEDARASRYGDLISLDGYIQPSGASATLTAGQVVGTAPIGYRPEINQYGIDIHVYAIASTPQFETIKGRIATDGTITTRTASTYVADRIYFGATYRVAP